MTIELDPDLVYDASRRKSAALTEVLCAVYPSVCRVAIAISGSTKRGLDLVKHLIGQSFDAAPKWQDELGPWRWFIHHLILTLREHPIISQEVDPLLQFAAGKDMPYASFLRAIRKLPPQQIEAVILHYGEKLDERKLAIAMDCSTTAAANHLAAANDSLKTVTSEGFAERLEEFRTAYQNLSPEANQVRQYVAVRVRGYIVPRRTVRWVFRLFVGLLIAAAGYGVWRAFVYMSN